jgi:hypothetical protein
MKRFVRLVSSLGVLFAAGCGRDSTAPVSKLTLRAVDGLALPAVVSTSGGFQWSVASGTLTQSTDKTACSYDITVTRSASANLYESIGSTPCSWSGSAASFTGNITFAPDLGSHAFAFVP